MEHHEQSAAIRRLQKEVEDLRAKNKAVEALAAKARLENQAIRRAVIGQTAQTTLLVGFLVQKGVLTKQEAVLIATGAVDAQSYAELTPERIREWMLKQFASSSPTTATGESQAPDTAKPTDA